MFLSMKWLNQLAVPIEDSYVSIKIWHAYQQWCSIFFLHKMKLSYMNPNYFGLKNIDPPTKQVHLHALMHQPPQSTGLPTKTAKKLK
jgi:hypothetical protein